MDDRDIKTPRKRLAGALNRKRVVRSTVWVLGIYMVFFLYALFFADHLVFRPQPASYTDDERILKVKTREGTTISMRYLSNPGATYTILYSHGNAEDLGDIQEVLHQFYKHGFSIIAYDYSGYGTSSGEPSEDAAYADISAVFDYAVQQIGLRAHDMLIFGRSIGASPSLDLAARENVGGLIIESPFVSAFRVITTIPIFPVDKFDNLRTITAVSCPVLVIHGKRDSTIPFWHGEKLYERANPPKMKLWVDTARHNDVMWSAGEEYWETLERFVELVEEFRSKPPGMGAS